MFISYHLIYYAIGFILANLFYFYNPIYLIFYILYLIFILYRLDYKHLIIILILSVSIFIPRYHNINSEYIEGKVIKASENTCYVWSDKGIISLYHSYNLKYGDIIKANIEYYEIKDNSNDNLFNERTYLLGQNIYYKGTIKELVEVKEKGYIYRWLNHRLSDNDKYNDYQKLFIFGEKDETVKDEYSLLSDLSLVHLFALSGMHVSILLKFIRFILGTFLYEKKSLYLSLLLIGIYIFSIPPSVSLQRAYLCILLYELFKKHFNQLDILSLLVIIALLYNPYILYNTSFIFSYFIYFIVLICKDIKHSSFYIYLSSIPLLLNINYQLPIFSILYTYLITPYIEYFYIICIISVFIPFIEFIAIASVYLFSYIINFLNIINYTIIFSKPPLIFTILYYYFYFICLYNKHINKDIKPILSIILSLLISFYFYSHYKIYAQFTMIDVGQGDCTLIRLPFNKGNILIDTGGSKEYDIADSTLIPYLKSIGVDHLDYVYISHNDYDHCGALDSLSKNFKVNHIIKEYEKIRYISDLKITMLKPSNSYTDKNDNSLIMYILYKNVKFLFTGDISEEVEKDLYETYRYLDVDILKVAHHGSNTSSSPYLFSLIRPSIAMIGVKLNNIYRHPSYEVIQRLKSKGIYILRTDYDGMFHIMFYGNNYYVFR